MKTFLLKVLPLCLVIGLSQQGLTLKACYPTIHTQDSLVLVTFYEAMGGENWVNVSNWLTTPVFLWDGVSLDYETCRVKSIDLYDKNLVGTIPSEIEHLTSLGYIGLGKNKLSGVIPNEIGNLTNLWHLDLGDNNIEGALPAEIGNLTNLLHLNLGGNNIEGVLPTEIGNLERLRKLWADNNQISGTIPSEIGNLTKLKILSLSHNKLNGSIPPEIGNLVNLEELWLMNNQISGTIPPEIGQLYKLNELELSNNNLEGCLPNELQTFCLEFFAYIDSNNINYNWIGFCFYNEKACEDSLVSCSSVNSQDSLALVALYHATDGENWNHNTNWLSGNIDTWYGVRSKCNVTALFLSHNNLNGPIPVEITQLSKLKYLDLKDNDLTGTIPPEIGQLCDLKSLSLEDNQLSGQLPAELSKLTQLKSLKLSRNNLSGCFPAELQAFCSNTPALSVTLNYNPDLIVQSWEDFCLEDIGMCEPSDAPVSPVSPNEISLEVSASTVLHSTGNSYRLAFNKSLDFFPNIHIFNIHGQYLDSVITSPIHCATSTSTIHFAQPINEYQGGIYLIVVEYEGETVVTKLVR